MQKPNHTGDHRPKRLVPQKAEPHTHRSGVHRPRRIRPAGTPPRRMIPQKMRNEFVARLTTLSLAGILLVCLLLGGGPLYFHGRNAYAAASTGMDFSPFVSGGTTFTIQNVEHLRALSELVSQLSAGQDYTVPSSSIGAGTVFTCTAGKSAEVVVPLDTVPAETPLPTETVPPTGTVPPVESASPTETVPPSATLPPEPTPESSPTITDAPTGAPEIVVPHEEVPVPETTAAPVTLPGVLSAVSPFHQRALGVGELVTPLPEPTVTPTVTPTVAPSVAPSAEPSATPSAEPSATPSAEPSATPSAEPSATPSVEPSATPSAEPTPVLLAATPVYIPAGFAGCTINVTGDMDLSGYVGASDSIGTLAIIWRPVGTVRYDASGKIVEANSRPFLGTFNGGGHTVRNFIFPAKNDQPAFGLFGYVGVGGTVSGLNFDLRNEAFDNTPQKDFFAVVKSDSVALPIVGVVAAVNKGKVENCSVTNAKVTLDSTASLGGQHTFGGIVGKNDGTTANIAKVKDCSFSGSITAAGETFTTTADASALAKYENGIGGIAGYSFGSIQGCTAKNTAISYVTTKTQGTTFTYVKVGGIVGHLPNNGTKSPSLIDDVTGCSFLGSIQSGEGTAYQSVGGIFGYGINSVKVTNCAVAADIQVSNLQYQLAIDGNKGPIFYGGLGGIGGNIQGGNSPVLSGCSSAGTLSGVSHMGGLVGNLTGIDPTKYLTVENSYSTMAVDTTGEHILLEVEGVGGLVGWANRNVTLKNVYFAGSLLDPQIGSIMGYAGGNVTCNNVAVDRSLSPNGTVKELVAGKTMGAPVPFATFETTVALDAANWTNTHSTPRYYPQLGWAAYGTGITDPVRKTLVQQISALSAYRWVTLDSSNSFTGSTAAGADDTVRTLYRLKNDTATLGTDFAFGTTPNQLTGTKLTLDPATKYTGVAASGYTIGGLFKSTVSVGGFSVPIVRKGLYAPTQLEGKANVISSVPPATGSSFGRFLDYWNIAGGGYLNGTFYLENKTVSGGAVPNYSATDPFTDKTPRYPFYGSLTGLGAASAVDGITFAPGSCGLFPSLWNAKFSGFTLKNISVPAGELNKVFGVFAGAVRGADFGGVSVEQFRYAYNHSSGDYKDVQMGLFCGTATRRPVTFTTCKASGSIALQTGGNISANLGGLLGTSAVDTVMQSCTANVRLTNTVTPHKLGYSLNFVGGLLGYDNAGENRFSNCNVSGNLTGNVVGGIVGRSKFPAITDCTFSGSVATTTGAANDTTDTVLATGGILGWAEHPGGNAVISGCAVLGNVSSVVNAGGIVGYATSAKVALSDCAVSGVITNLSTGGTSGGIVGRVDGTSAPNLALSNSYFAGQLGGSGGGIVGSDTVGTIVPGRVTNCHFDSTLAGITTPSVGGRTEASFPCALKGSDVLWGTTFPHGANDKWLPVTDGTRHYPQLKNIPLPFAKVSTLRLVTLPDSNDDVFGIAGSFSGTTCSSVTAAFAHPDKPFSVTASVPDVSGYATLSYATVAANGSDTLKVTYPAYGYGGGNLEVSYALAVRPFEFGNGTAARPFVIYDWKILATFRDYINSGFGSGTHFIIAQKPTTAFPSSYTPTTIDLTLAGTLADPWAPTTDFAGYLHGNGSTIKGLKPGAVKPSGSTVWQSGLFSSLSASAVVEDLTLADAILTPPGSGSYDAGILAGYSAGATLTNITVSGTIAATGTASIGGVVGTVALSGTADMNNLTSTVTISNSTQNNAGAAGGIIGSISAVTAGSVANLNQCASYGSISNVGSMGGLIGFANDDKLALNISNSLTLTALKNDGAATLTKQHVGGMIGRLSNALSGKLTVTNSYAAGETTILHDQGTTANYCAVGGLIGAVKAKPDYESDSDIDLTNGTGGKSCVVFASSFYSKDANSATSSWTQIHADGLYHTTGMIQSVPYAVTYYGGGAKSAWILSEGERTRDPYCTYYWKTDVWQFTEGLLPVLKRQMAGNVVPGELVLQHLAVSFTASQGDRRSSNVFLRYKGSAGSEAFLSVDLANEGLMRRTYNKRMLVATREGKERIPFYITVPQSGGGAPLTLTKYVFPGVTPGGRSTDNSIYFINPDGMWAPNSKQWTIYCADALVGLDNTLRGQVDSNGVPASTLGVQADYTYTLGRDLDLSAYTWWKPIGFSGSIKTPDTPFPATLDGGGHSLVNLPLLDYSYQNNNYTPELRKESRIRNAGLFSTLTGTVKNLSMTVSSPDGAVRLYPTMQNAGTIAGILDGGTITDCVSSLPLYIYPGESIDGPAGAMSVGGLVGSVTSKGGTIKNSAFTGYLYASPEGTNGTTVGGLVGSVTKPIPPAVKTKLHLEGSFSSALVEGSVMGALIGGADVDSTEVNFCCYDANTSGATIPAWGDNPAFKPADAVTVPSLGNGWSQVGDSAAFYPVPAALKVTGGTPPVTTVSPNLSAALGRMTFSADGRSALSGEVPAAGGTLSFPTQPTAAFVAKVTIPSGGKSFSKTVDGFAALQLNSTGENFRPILVSIRCWYDNPVTDGTGAKTYTISSAAELEEFSEIVGGLLGTAGSHIGHAHGSVAAPNQYSFRGDTIVLSANVDLSTLKDVQNAGTPQESSLQRPWTPIGTATRPFEGTLDGGGHAVSAMNSAPNSAVAGLFGQMNGTVQNLLVTGCKLSVSSGGVAGLLAANVSTTTAGGVTTGGKILHCGTSGSITSAGATVGGMVGISALGTALTGCYSTAVLTDSGTGSKLGGLTGQNGGIITDSFFAGICRSSGQTVGGIAAGNTGTVQDCFVAAYLDGTTMYAAAPSASGTVSGCFLDSRYTGTVTGAHTPVSSTTEMTLPAATWTAAESQYYPRPSYFTSALAGTPLADGAKTAAAAFTFGGSTVPSFSDFKTVTVPVSAAQLLTSENPQIVTVSGGQAAPFKDHTGSVIIRLTLTQGANRWIQNPCFLTIPTTLAFTYEFDLSQYLVDANLKKPVTPPAWSAAGNAKKEHYISSLADLQSFLAYTGETLGHTFLLAKDLNLGNASLTPFAGTFNGTFDGGGHTLKNFTISTQSAVNTGLFAHIGPQGTVKTLWLDSATVSGNSAGQLNVGVVAGQNEGRILNVAVTDVQVSLTTRDTGATASTLGGLVGKNSGSVISSYFENTLASGRGVGVSYRTTIASAEYATKLHMGGLVGASTGGRIADCYVLAQGTCKRGGNTETENFTYRSLVGLLGGDSELVHCYWRNANPEAPAIGLRGQLYSTPDGTIKTGGYFWGDDTKYKTPEGKKLVAQWLSADSYGGTYFVNETKNLGEGGEKGRMELFCFKLAKYDLSAQFRELMLSLQYSSNATSYFASGITAWKEYYFPNFANLRKTTAIQASLPICPKSISYTMSAQAMGVGDDLAPLLTNPACSSSGGGAWIVSGFPDGLGRILLKITLSPASLEAQKVPWGVYRSDTTVPSS